MQIDQLEKIVYVSKILCCGLIISLMSAFLTKNEISNFFLWGSLTAFSSIPFDLRNKVNFNQITGNLIGCVLGILTWLFLHRFPPDTFNYINIEYCFLVLGIFITTLVCVLLKHAEYCGIALAGFVVVTVYDVSHHTIEGALFRIFYCAAGCLIAYIIDVISRYLLSKKNLLPLK